MHLISKGIFSILVLFALSSIDLGTCDDSACKFYETPISTESGENAFLVENTLDNTENTSAILYGSGQSTSHSYDATYRIKLESNTLFRPTKICVTANIDRVIFNVYGENNARYVERVRNPIFLVSSMQMCMEDFDAIADQIGPVQRVIIRLRPRTAHAYNISDLLVDACTGERVCGWSQYDDAGIEGGSIPGGSIISGWQARPNEFPWQVLLFINGSIICGGSIIDPLYVITAAHCTIGMTASDVLVIVGMETLFDTDANQFTYGVAEVINHEYYNGFSLYNDIALLRLSISIPAWTDAVQPICLSQRPTYDLVGINMTVSGWGLTTDGGSVSNALLYTTGLPLPSFYECEKCLNDYIDNGIDYLMDGMMCAGVCGPNSRSACQGDSGGPIMYKSDDGAWELIGIVSWSFGCAGMTPEVDSDVHFYKEWIQENTPLATLPFFV